MIKNAVSFLIFICLFTNSMSFGQKVIFPEVILQNVPIDVQVQFEGELDYLILNQDTLQVQKAGEHYVMNVTLENDTIHFENSNVQYIKPLVIPGWLSLLPPLIAIMLALTFKEVFSRSEERRVGKECS